jgi:hypothetical protein
MNPIQVGLLGIGTVGSGTFSVLKRNQAEIRRRAGRGIEITMVADLDVARAQSLVGPDVQVVSDARAVIANPDIDIVIELIGGYGIARQLVMEAIAAGKHVVTANKALLAVHGTEIFAAAHAKGVMVAFEAAVAGGIPIIKALARRPDGQQHPVDRRHHQWHDQLHPERDARQGAGFCRRAQGGPAAGIRRSRPDLRHRRASMPPTRPPSCRPSRSASRCSSTRPMSRASPV